LGNRLLMESEQVDTGDFEHDADELRREIVKILGRFYTAE